MSQLLNSRPYNLDPRMRDCRISYLNAIQRFAPWVLSELDAIFQRRLSGRDLERALNKWAKDYSLFPWMAEIALATMDRWERNPGMSRTTWKLPPVQTAAVWDVAPFSFTHRGYHPHIDGDLHAYKVALRKDFEKTLESHVDGLRSIKEESALMQSDQTLPIIRKRSRDGRDRYIGCEWLVKNLLVGTSLAEIAKEAKVNRAAVPKQVKSAKSLLSAE